MHWISKVLHGRLDSKLPETGQLDGLVHLLRASELIKTTQAGKYWMQGMFKKDEYCCRTWKKHRVSGTLILNFIIPL